MPFFHHIEYEHDFYSLYCGQNARLGYGLKNNYLGIVALNSNMWAEHKDTSKSVFSTENVHFNIIKRMLKMFSSDIAKMSTISFLPV